MRPTTQFVVAVIVVVVILVAGGCGEGPRSSDGAEAAVRADFAVDDPPAPAWRGPRVDGPRRAAPGPVRGEVPDAARHRRRREGDPRPRCRGGGPGERAAASGARGTFRIPPTTGRPAFTRARAPFAPPRRTEATRSPRDDLVIRSAIIGASSGAFAGPSSSQSTHADATQAERFGAGITGACCGYDGTCVDDATIHDCVVLVGVYLGHGTVCADGCPDLAQACCFDSGSCRIILADACLDAGGTPLGAGTTCTGTDRDGDGFTDTCDGCPDDANRSVPGPCGCNVIEIDTDDDGTPDCADDCPLDPLKTVPGTCGCGVPDVDSDGDGVLDCDDVCPSVSDPGQEDCDGDGTGDACAGEDDCNDNGIPDSCDITDGTSNDVNLNGTPDQCEGLRIETGTVQAGSTRVDVTFSEGFVAPVVVCTVQYANNTTPVVARVRRVDNFGFQVRLEGAGGGVVTDTVHWVAIEEGVWTAGDLRCEAQTYTSTVTDHSSSWVGEKQTYGQTYTQPVVVGQVMTEQDSGYSYFWCRGPAIDDPPSSAVLATGKSVGEDPDQVRNDETVGFIVFEQGHTTLGGVEIDAFLSGDTVQGIDNSPPYTVSFDTAFSAAPTIAVATCAAMDGTNGGWAILYGASPFSATDIDLCIDEDQIANAERSHTTEQVGVLAFGTAVVHAEAAAIPGDIDGDGRVDTADLAALFAAMGGCSGKCPADLNGDGWVDGDDLTLFLAL